MWCINLTHRTITNIELVLVIFPQKTGVFSPKYNVWRISPSTLTNEPALLNVNVYFDILTTDDFMASYIVLLIFSIVFNIQMRSIAFLWTLCLDHEILSRTLWFKIADLIHLLTVILWPHLTLDNPKGIFHWNESSTAYTEAMNHKSNMSGVNRRASSRFHWVCYSLWLVECCEGAELARKHLFTCFRWECELRKENNW